VLATHYLVENTKRPLPNLTLLGRSSLT
jgi:hypothetical protein